MKFGVHKRCFVFLALALFLIGFTATVALADEEKCCQKEIAVVVTGDEDTVSLDSINLKDLDIDIEAILEGVDLEEILKDVEIGAIHFGDGEAHGRKGHFVAGDSMAKRIAIGHPHGNECSQQKCRKDCKKKAACSSRKGEMKCYVMSCGEQDFTSGACGKCCGPKHGGDFYFHTKGPHGFAKGHNFKAFHSAFGSGLGQKMHELHSKHFQQGCCQKKQSCCSKARSSCPSGKGSCGGLMDGKVIEVPIGDCCVLEIRVKKLGSSAKKMKACCGTCKGKAGTCSPAPRKKSKAKVSKKCDKQSCSTCTIQCQKKAGKKCDMECMATSDGKIFIKRLDGYEVPGKGRQKRVECKVGPDGKTFEVMILGEDEGGGKKKCKSWSAKKGCESSCEKKEGKSCGDCKSKCKTKKTKSGKKKHDNYLMVL